MCLDAHAHGMRVNHEIFNTPNSVELTIAQQPTPSSYASYPEGEDLGETMPMWRVQTEGYTTHPGQLIGIVSRDAGFLDSPDAEWISGGVNSKGPNAVAIGRHGNFFHWGFAVSPTYLTDEAKDVFVNAVHYIAKFDGQAPIARKRTGTMLRSAVDQVIDGISDEGYAKTVKLYQSYPGTRVPGRLDRVRSLLTDQQIEALGSDPVRIGVYLNEVKGYMYPTGWYELAIDTDLRELGIANSEMAMLDRAVSLLGDAETAQVGQTLLKRYTVESFGSAAEWNSWLSENRDRLFFTESGGYKWLVNTLTEGENSAPAQSLLRVQATPRSPLAAAMQVNSVGRGRYEVVVAIDILPGWHTYDRVPETSAYSALKLKLELPEGAAPLGEWDKPEAHASPELAGLFIHEGRVEYRHQFEAEGLVDENAIACTLSYQVCDDRMCMPPTKIKLRQR